MEKLSKQAIKATVRNRGNITRDRDMDFILVLLGSRAGCVALFDSFFLSLMMKAAMVNYGSVNYRTLVCCIFHFSRFIFKISIRISIP
jgi:hypothetical protein